MKRTEGLFARFIGGIIAVVLTLFLYFVNAPPFSIIDASETAVPEETAAEEAPASEPAPTDSPAAAEEASATAEPAETAATEEPAAASEEAPKVPAGGAVSELGKLIVILQEPLEVEAQKNTGSSEYAVTLINQSEKAIKVFLFIEGVDACEGEKTQDCAEVTVDGKPSAEVEVPPGASAEILVAFRAVALKNLLDRVEGSLILVSPDGQKELPFVVAAKWQSDWPEGLAWAVRILAALIVAYILYLILYSKVVPAFYIERYIPMTMDVIEENKALWHIFSSRLTWMKEQGLSKNLINPQTPPARIELPTNLGRQGDILRAVVELVGWVLPRRGLTLRMAPKEIKTGGKGISVTIVKNSAGKVLAERLFTTAAYGLDPESMDYEDLLMIPIILWLTDWWNKQYPSRQPGEKTNWEAKALCMLANNLWHEKPNLGRELYMKALAIEPSNREAHAGLGRIWLEDSQRDGISDYQKRNYQELASAYLGGIAVREFKEGGGMVFETPRGKDVTWFAAAYNLGVAYAYRDDFPAALSVCDHLFGEIANAGSNKSRDWADFQRWLKRFETMALVFRQSAILETAKPKDPAALARMVNESISKLRAASAEDPGVDRHTGDGTAFPPEKTVDPQRILLVNLDYRTQYNMACYFSRCYQLAKENRWGDAGKYAEAALDYLRMALGRGGGLVDFARKDQVLNPVRKSRVYGAKFDEIAPPPKEPVKDDEKEIKEEGTVIKVVVDKPIVLTSR